MSCLTPPPDDITITPRFGRHGPRSKKGCSTCRTRKVKCDERRTLCVRCAQSRLKCEWDQLTKPRRKPGRTAEVPRGETEVVRSLPTLQKYDPVEAETDDDVEEILQGSSHDQHLTLFRNDGQVQLWQTLSSSHLPLSNSLNLDALDWECFQHIPRSFLVLGLGKPWRWSMLSYLHSEIAVHEKGVMSAFIAVASMELRTKDLLPSDQSGVQTLESIRRTKQLKELAMNHYRLAINDLSSILEHTARPERTSNDVDALFAMWFLILYFEQYGDGLVENTHIHLNGIRSYLSQALEKSETLHLPPASQQLLHFICHLDVNLAVGNHKGGQLCLDLASAPPQSGIQKGRLFEEARVCLPKIWGSQYPEEELFDDLENYRGLSLLQISMNLKLSVWRLGVALRNGTANQGMMGSLWENIESVAQEYYDVLAMAQLVKSSSGRRVVFTVYHAALEYYGVKVLFSCIPNPSTTPSNFSNQRPTWLDSTLASLLSIAYKSLGENPQLIYRYVWPLCMALIKTTDPIHREWILTQVKRARVLLANIGVPEQVVRMLELGESGSGDYVPGEMDRSEMRDWLFLDDGETGSRGFLQ